MSRTFDDGHIYMGDIDEKIPLKKVESLCRRLQDNFLLHHIYIVRSSSGWNIFSLDKLALKMVFLINSVTDEICKKFNNIAFRTRCFYVLRVGSDKELVKRVPSPRSSPVFVQSNGHRIFYNNMLGISREWDMFFDEFERFWIIRFKSSKHGWSLEE